jgi:peptidoglycan/xylan/chitin deacetylase (PgdA/CDA1 family)
MRALTRKLRRTLGGSRSKPAILMYHRIATPPIDPWGLAVRPDRFAQHLSVLRQSRRPLPMSELVARLERGTLEDDAVAITFDDGYVDNFNEARPRLASEDMPATLFLTTAFVGASHEYWWDELARGILLGTTAVTEDIRIGDAIVPLALRAEDECDPDWRAWQPPQTNRQRAYLTVWQHLRTAAVDDRERVMRQLRALLQIPPAAPGDLPMTASQVATLAASPLFEIGAHTATHPVLPALTPDARRHEIAAGRDACERLAGHRTTGFAYPHGSLDEDSKAAVRECGFAWACSTKSRAVSALDADPYALPRLAVQDWDAAAFTRALQRLES